MPVPRFLQSALWSVDVRQLNPQKYKVYIIEQILNHGTWPQLQWLLKNYSRRELAQVLRSPSRGTWHEEVLNYWETILGLKLSKSRRARALFSLEPRPFSLPHARLSSRHSH